jgi:hypothetical protein
MNSRAVDDQPIEHRCRYGTVFSCLRADLAAPISVRVDADNRLPGLVSADFAEFAGWHAVVIRPGLKSFSGYDTLLFNAYRMPELEDR